MDVNPIEGDIPYVEYSASRDQFFEEEPVLFRLPQNLPGNPLDLKNKPIVLISTDWDPKEQKVKIKNTYLSALEQVGLQPVLVSPTTKNEKIPEIFDLYDISGLMLIGGDDITSDDTKENISRDRFEKALLTKSLEIGIPFLGICRGHQMLGIHLGASLDKHIGDTHSPKSRKYSDLPETTHEITVSDERLKEILKTDSTFVNSAHHQAINLESLEKIGLKPGALSPDGVVEALMPNVGTFTLGIQSHIEAMIDPETRELHDTSKRVFESFANAIKATKNI